MIRTWLVIAGLLLSGLLTSAALGDILSGELSLPSSHPEQLQSGEVKCSECHQDQIKGILKPYDSFSHSPVFVKNHRYYASQNDQLCSSCHQGSFCYDCHANQVEIKPSVKNSDRPDREMIHRGDFLTRHKIEGKINPASCYRCHGRMNNEQCVACHR